MPSDPESIGVSSDPTRQNRQGCRHLIRPRSSGDRDAGQACGRERYRRLILLLLEVAVWPFQCTAAVALLTATEEVAITLFFTAPRSNVVGLISLWRTSGRR